jgi:hypothetical protein
MGLTGNAGRSAGQGIAGRDGIAGRGKAMGT